MPIEKAWSKISNWFLPAGYLYGYLMRMREFAYKKGLFRSYRLPAMVISIGNLSLGGEGKTPVTIALATYLQQRGFPIAVLSRGYKGRIKDVFIASKGIGPLGSAEFLGDEIFLLAYKLKGVPIVVSPNRILAGTVAIREFGARIVILDDGFQHLRLARNLDLVLFAADKNSITKRVFPAGCLREPKEALKRADAFLITKVNQSLCESCKLSTKLMSFKKPIFEIPFRLGSPYPIEELVFQERSHLDSKVDLTGKGLAFCGIARPESFFLSLDSLGIKVIKKIAFVDHQKYTTKEIERLLVMRDKNKADFFITTEKDAVKLLSFIDRLKPCFVLPIKAKLHEEFLNFLLKRIYYCDLCTLQGSFNP